MKNVNQGIRKKDAMALLTGKPVYMDDLAPRDCLIVKVLRSPHANAMIQSVKTDAAMKVPGIAAVYTWEDVPAERFTMAGQTYPEPSPYDRLILDRHVRYVGDPVAIVAGETEDAVDQALKLVKVQYEVLPAILDFRTSGLPRITRSWSILRTAGDLFVLWEQTIRGICAPARYPAREMWMRSWQSATWWRRVHTIPWPTNRP